MSGHQERNAFWEEKAGALLKAARGAGAGLEVRFYESDNLSVKVRKGQVEELRRTAPFGAGLRVFREGRSVTAATAKVDDANLSGLLERLLANVLLVDPDEAHGLPEPALLYRGGGPALDLFDEAASALTVEKALDMARACEQAAFDADLAIRNSSGAGVGVGWGRGWLFSTDGLAASSATSSVSIYASPVAEDARGLKKSESWWHEARHLGDLEAAEAVGRVAGTRAARMLGAVKGSTGRFPVLFSPQTAEALVTTLFESVSGTSVYRKSTFLGDREGKRVAADAVTIVDDPHRVRGLGSQLFDGEGVETRARVLVDKGVLTFFPCDVFSARKLGTVSTGHSARGLAGTGGVGFSNLHLQPGTETPEALMARMGEGLLVTSFIGFGFNMATGDFSRGVEGLWVKDGKPSHPVHEISVSSNLGAMLEAVAGVGSDLEVRGAVASPSLLVEGMTVSGS
ncbi:MAG: TldD/PmbA family protein [Deltaproteobacteria bacterium]|nr:TldD/PmbA family protein [Deltaproteobacteria bacterium]